MPSRSLGILIINYLKKNSTFIRGVCLCTFCLCANDYLNKYSTSLKIEPFQNKMIFEIFFKSMYIDFCYVLKTLKYQSTYS